MRSFKRVALLFSGQVREINPEIFNESLKYFTKYFDEVDIYLAYWKEPGISLGHNFDNITNRSVKDSFNVEEYLDQAFSGFNIQGVVCESYAAWKKNYDDSRTEDLKDQFFDPLTINAAPQLYQMYKSLELVQEPIDKYDIFFRCRFDSIFLIPFIESQIYVNTIYNINFGNALYPNRVYDIFFYGQPSSMALILKSWINFEFLIRHPFENGLNKRDACRLLIASANVGNIRVQSSFARYCDVMRPTISIYVYFCNLIFYGIVDPKATHLFRLAIKIYAYVFIVKTLPLTGRCLFLICHPLLKCSKQVYSEFEVKIGKSRGYF